MTRSIAPDHGHPLAITRETGSRIGSTVTRDAGVPADILFAFNGLQWVPIDVRPLVLSLPVNVEATDPAQAQSLTITVNASGEGVDEFRSRDPLVPLGRGPQRLAVLRYELGGGAPDSVEYDVGTGDALTVPTRYARASILDYSAELLRSVDGPDPGALPPSVVYAASVAAGVRTPSARRTQIAYVTGEAFLTVAEPGDATWEAGRQVWQSLLPAVLLLLEGLIGP